MCLFIRPRLLTVPDWSGCCLCPGGCSILWWWLLTHMASSLGGVRQLGALSLRSLPALAIGRAAEFCFWAARRQAPAHGLAVCPATCSRFLPVYRKARTHFFGVLSFSKVSFLSLFKNEQTKSPQKLGDLKKIFFFKLLLFLSMESLFWGYLHTGAFIYSVVPYHGISGRMTRE